MDFLTITTTGNSSDFGDLTGQSTAPATTASPTRVVIAGGTRSPNYSNVIDFVEIETLGNAKDFGDLTDAREQAVGVSNAHGGL